MDRDGYNSATRIKSAAFAFSTRKLHKASDYDEDRPGNADGCGGQDIEMSEEEYQTECGDEQRHNRVMPASAHFFASTASAGLVTRHAIHIVVLHHSNDKS